MNGKKLAEVILCVVLLVISVAGFAVWVLHSDLHRAQTIESQLEKKYGLLIDPLNGIKLKGDEFTATTVEKVTFLGTCDYWGNVKTDSYVNYYYADECVKHISNKITYCFSDSICVYDGLKMSELASVPLQTNDINSYDEYVTATKTEWQNAEKHKYYYKISIRVYVRESEYAGYINDAITELLYSEEYFDVFFYAIPDELFDLHEEMGIYAYFKGTAITDLVNSLDKETGDELLNLIYQNQGLVDDYYLWDRYSVPVNADRQSGTGPMLVIDSTVEGPVDYDDDDMALGTTYTIDWNGIITQTIEYAESGDVEVGSVALSPDDFHVFYEFAEDAYTNDTYVDYSELVDDGETYGFTYYPADGSGSVHLYGGYCYSNENLWGVVTLAKSYFK